jgi:hypothetical protein
VGLRGASSDCGRWRYLEQCKVDDKLIMTWAEVDVLATLKVERYIPNHLRCV